MDLPLLFDSAGDRYFRLRHNFIARKPKPTLFSNPSWTKIRVGIRLLLPSSGSTTYYTVTPRLALGICSGGTNIMGEDTTTHFVGALTNSSTWPYPGSGSTRYTIADIVAAKKVGASTTIGTTLTAAFVGNVNAPKLYFVDVTKGSPNYTVQLVLFPNTNNTGSASAADFATQMAAASPALAGHGASSSQTIAVSEVDGVFSHACLSYDKGYNYLDIYDFEIRKMA